MATDALSDLRGIRVAVMHPADQEIDELLRHLRRIGCRTRHIWPPPPALPTDADVVFFATWPIGPAVVPQPGPGPGPEPSLIAIVDYENPTAVKSLLDTNAHCFISKPIRATGVVSSLAMARALHGYHNRLLAKVAKLEETLRSRREIERATRILMEVRHLSEDRAYQLIRQQATAQRLAMGAVARSIITAHRVFDGSAAAPARESDRGTGKRVLSLPARKPS